MSLPPGFLDELRTRVSLAQIVGRKVAWDPRKSNAAKGDWWAPCPFHQEKSASFHVDEGKGYYYCFGCHAKGDAVSFLRETENLGFIEAVERLATEAGMAMPERDPAAAARTAANQGLVEAMEAAVQFYRLQLATARAAEARAYLDRRGLTPATRDRFEIGYAPDEWSALLDQLTGKGFAREKLAEAGLVTGNAAKVYDRFRGRIMFPIRDGRGRCIAFGARAIGKGQEPKYLNSPDTPLFDKGRTLYNLGPARAAAHKAGTVIVAEGYMDVIAMAQAGLEHAVAPLGTAITETQLELLWKLAPEPLVALDGDSAGMNAAQRLIDLALPHLGPGRSLRFAVMPPGQDPDDVARAGGAAALAPIFAASRPIIDLLWARETEGAVLDSPERRAALDARLRAHLARIADPTVRAHWEAEVRARRAALFAPPARPRPGKREARPRPGAPRSAGIQGTGAARASRLARATADTAVEMRMREGAILAACLNHPRVALEFAARLEDLVFATPRHGEILAALLTALAGSPDEPQAVPTLVQAALGRDPLVDLPAEIFRAYRHFGASGTPDVVRRALEEELTRRAALVGRAAEIREAAAEIADDPGESLTNRVRLAAEAEHSANTRPLEEDQSAEASEHLEFASVIGAAEASRSRKPRKH
ncbi:MAG TPA: DNA primase [Amaricoccus sp.]|uniref:DNA primase n=1 Tax=Amaricoccus sp. TaxID=1872485 RepID=UPI002CE93404|nr:DNA primase [Amaricoccus sp.]HRO13061.1 DNA primase [Amaricoccus sp.]